jgi:dihydrofolate synthase/folylpolyglutamate synthase
MIARNISSRRTKKSADPKIRPGTSGLQLRQSVKKGTKLKAIRRSSVSAAKKGIRTYRSALDFLNSQVNYERRPPTNRAKMRGAYTLTRMKRLLADLDSPQRAFRSVHIGGTKGKGSTATMLANMLQSNGLRVGLYTSPHVVDVRERIAIDGELIPEAAFVRQISTIADIVSRYKSDPPTYFEILTAAAFLYFREKKVDIAVVEVGLGGRFDATNVLRPEVCGITNISLDHMIQLGGTVEQIAEEKAGIFKEHIPVVCAPQPKNVKQVLRKAAEKTKSPLLFAGNETGDQIELSYRFESSRAAGPQARICVTTPTSHFDHLAVPLVGEHQAVNCGVAIGILDQLKNRGFAINDEAAIIGLSKVRLQGRMEMICDEPRVLVDAAHNAASIEALMRAIGQNIPSETTVVIFGCCNDKDIEGMLRQIQLGADKVIFTNLNNSRAADARELATRFAEISGNGRMAQLSTNLEHALEIAQKAITREDLICITGSFYLVSEAKALFANHPHRVESTCSGVV